MTNSIQTEIPSDESSQQSTEAMRPLRKAWHRPEVTILEIEQTMFTTGSIIDALSGSQQP